MLELNMRTVNMKRIKNLLILLLIFICCFVLIVQSYGANAWGLILCYWLILLIKNLVDFIEEC